MLKLVSCDKNSSIGEKNDKKIIMTQECTKQVMRNATAHQMLMPSQSLISGSPLPTTNFHGWEGNMALNSPLTGFG